MGAGHGRIQLKLVIAWSTHFVSSFQIIISKWRIKMINTLCIIFGTILVMLSLMFLYEYSGGDEYIYVFIAAYTFGVCVAMYGIQKINDRLAKLKSK